MFKSTGYFLAEILISLFLCASISLLLLKQQWQLSRFVAQIDARLQYLNFSENSYENDFSGLILSEMLVCILLASLMLNGLVQQYIQVDRQNKILTTTLEQSLDVAFVSELFKNSIRSAGFTPCGNLDGLQQKINSNLSSLKIQKNSIAVTRMNDSFHEFGDIKDAILFLQKWSLSKKFLVADCYHVELFANDFDYIINNYLPPIYVGEYINEVFWIKDFKYLYYKFKHSEKISEYIKSIEANWLGKNFIEVKLVLINNRVFSKNESAILSSLNISNGANLTHKILIRIRSR